MQVFTLLDIVLIIHKKYNIVIQMLKQLPFISIHGVVYAYLMKYRLLKWENDLNHVVANLLKYYNDFALIFLLEYSKGTLFHLLNIDFLC